MRRKHAWRTVISILLSACIICIPVFADPVQIPSDEAIEHGKLESNKPSIQTYSTVLNKNAIIQLFTKPARTLRNLGICKNDLIELGMDSKSAEEIINSNFSVTVINNVLTKLGINYTLQRPISTYSTGTCDCNYTVTTNVYVSASEPSEMFNTNVSTTSSSISNYNTKSKAIAKDLFGYTSTDYIEYNYFLYGEHDCDVYSDSGSTHEGIDLRYTNNSDESFRTIITGKVISVQKDGEGYGTLVIAHPNGSNRILYLHASDYSDSVVAGNTLNGDSFYCYQGNTGVAYEHVHIEAGGSTTTGPAQDKDNTLARVAPYDLLYPYVNSVYL